jgi:hypothetical protein
MANIKNAAWYGGGLGMDAGPGIGNIWYVYGIDGGIGSNANDGLSPATPFLTLTYALSKCVTGNHDYIIVLDYWQPTGEVWPIAISKNNVHIIGAEGGGTQMPIITPVADTAGVRIAADRVELARLCINGGATHGCIENDPTGAVARWGLRVRDCWFAVLGSAQDGIRNVAASDNVYLEVLRCRFGFAITRDGIRVEHNATRCMIGDAWGNNGNIFDRVAGIGVNIVGNAADIGIYNNIFVLAANTAGGAITLSAGTAGSAIFGNHANYGDTDMGNNPYADGAGAGANTWGLNYKGVTAQLPA